MTKLILVAFVIVVIVVFVGKSKSKTQFSIITNSKIDDGNVGRRQAASAYYLPQDIRLKGLQVLESIYIIGTSNAIDTIKGRYDFLLETFGTLQKAQSNSRYISDIQNSIDTYKATYYERVPRDYELALLLKPSEVDLTDFYCKSLLAALERNFEQHLEKLSLLKRGDAKARRKEKFKETIEFTKIELNSKCSRSLSFAAVMSKLERIELSAPAASGIGVTPLLLEGKFIQPTPKIASIKQINTANRDTEFVINPGAPFELTLLGADNSLGRRVQTILSDDKIWGDMKKQQIVALFSEYDLRVKEVEAYKRKYGKVYFDKLEELKTASTEWKYAGELDKEDLLREFRESAIRKIHERADCDLVALFEKEPSDFTVDDELIEEFGFENIQTYFRFADNLEKVRLLASLNYNRPRFENLVEVGLAIRGNAIPLGEILGSLSLKELNDIANNPEKQFKRKNQAVEFILAIPNIEEKMGATISFRELFKLNPLPEKFSNVNLQEIASAWSYLDEVVGVLIETYLSGRRTAGAFQNSYVKDYTIAYEVLGNRADMCPRAKELISQKYSKAALPKVPQHIGCTCSVEWS